MIRALVLLIVLSVACLAGSEDLPTEIVPGTAHVGDPIEIRVTLPSSAGARFELPANLPKIGDLQVLGVSDSGDSKQPDGTTRRQFIFQVAAYRTGRIDVPAVPIRQTAPSTKSWTSRVGVIEITSVLTGKETDIEDIKGPMTVSAPVPWRWIAGIIGLAAAIALAILYWRHRRRRSPFAAPQSSARPAALLSPEDEAVAALRRLEAANLLDRNRLKPFCITLTDILKRYLFRRYGVPVEERTTSEIIEDCADGLPDEVNALLRAFLMRGDMVKFAKYEATGEEAREMLRWAFRVIEISRPVLADAPEGVAASV